MLSIALILSVQVSQRLVPMRSSTQLGPEAEAAIKKAIGKSRVVMLGELTHGDGTSFEVKVELAKFLHREMGFDALIWESGLYDCAEMDAAIGGTKPIGEVARMGVFSHWSQGKESLPIFEYARQTRKTNRPLVMAGFDLQGSGSASNSMFPDFLDWFKDSKEFTAEDRAVVDAAFQKARSASNAAEMNEAQMAVYETATRFLWAFEANPKGFQEKWGKDWQFRKAVLLSTPQYHGMLQLHREVQAKKKPFAAPYNLRERVNADNLMWLVNSHFKGKKVMVWAHNVHIVRELPARGGDEGPISSEVESMGRLVSKELKGDLYSLGFIANRGNWSWLGNPVIPFRPVEEGSLEAILHKSKAPFGFIDLRGLPATHEFRKPIAATIDQQNPLTVKRDWSKAFDGFIYIDEMKPRTQIP